MAESTGEYREPVARFLAQSGHLLRYPWLEQLPPHHYSQRCLVEIESMSKTRRLGKTSGSSREGSSTDVSIEIRC